MWQSRFRTEERGAQVDRNDLIPMLIGYIGHASQRADAGVVYQTVEAAEPLGRHVYDGTAAAYRANVTWSRYEALRPDRIDGGGHRLSRTTVDGHSRAGGMKHLGCRPSDSGRAAGYQDALPRKIHAGTPARFERICPPNLSDEP
jgi:hypothetical protein